MGHIAELLAFGPLFSSDAVKVGGGVIAFVEDVVDDSVSC